MDVAAAAAAVIVRQMMIVVINRWRKVPSIKIKLLKLLLKYFLPKLYGNFNMPEFLSLLFIYFFY